MKSSHLFILFILLFLGVMVWTEYHLPKQFIWTPTFSRYDKQPFGCAVFDDVLSSSMHAGYSLSKETFYQISTHDTTSRKAILAVSQDIDLKRVDVDAVMRLAERGNKVILASSSFSTLFSDTLGFSLSYGYFNPSSLKRQATSMLLTRDTIQWVGDSTYTSQNYCFYSQLCTGFFLKSDSTFQMLANNCSDRREEIASHNLEIRKDSTRGKKTVVRRAVVEGSTIRAGAVVLSKKIGKGEIILISTPLLFTNYGMLDGHNAAFLFRILSTAKNLPLVRTEAYSDNEQEEQSPFRYFLSRPPLRWALYLTIIILLLFMVFTARRRQRSIPIVRPPDNKILEFVQLIGTLYFQKKDYSDLVRKKFIFFAEALRKSLQINVENVDDDAWLAAKIAAKAGMEEEVIHQFLIQVRPVVREELNVSERQMIELIDEMNKITNHLTSI